MPEKLGRPTKYSPEMIDKAKEYLKNCQDTYVDILASDNDKTGQAKYIQKLKVNFPTSEGLALYLGIERKTIYNWADKYPDFLHILDELNATQVERLLNNGLSGDYNSHIAKLVLAKQGYKESTEQEIRTTPTEINVRIQKAIDKAYGQPSDSDPS